MHVAAYEFVAESVGALDLTGAWVLEFGSYNVNGSVRPLFAGAALYVGLDARPGPGVDVAAPAAAWDGRGVFQAVVCCEMLEHDPDPEATIRSAWRALSPGGALILTAAAPERAPHSCDGGAPVSGEHYGNIDPDDLARWLAGWSDVAIRHSPAAGDVYAVAHKPAGSKKRAPASPEE